VALATETDRVAEGGPDRPSPPDRFEIRLAGEGGQGMILAGVILAEAALRDGLNVVQTQSYGPEARGGASRSEVVISSARVDYPKVLEADLLLCMSQEACDRFAGHVKADGLTVVDTTNVLRAPGGDVLGVPITQLAREATGRAITASIAGLALVCGLAEVVSRPALEAAVTARVPAGTEELNLKAVAAGYEEATRLRHEAPG
jgi:2-oxoglutarate ferredoxin oxidoreductase subunit gamma